MTDLSRDRSVDESFREIAARRRLKFETNPSKDNQKNNQASASLVVVTVENHPATVKVVNESSTINMEPEVKTNTKTE